MAWLVDTSVLCALRRPAPDPWVVDFVGRQPLDQLYVSVVTLAEIRFGIERVADAACRAELYGWLTTKVRPLFRLRA
jgi:predicted nucleic acid-binding protein